MQPRELFKQRISRLALPELHHLNRRPPPAYGNVRLYKVLVAEDLESGGGVCSLVHAGAGRCFRPFAGSGVVVIEAVRHKRRAIVCDLNPAACRITELTLRPVNLLSLQQAFERVAERTFRGLKNFIRRIASSAANRSWRPASCARARI